MNATQLKPASDLARKFGVKCLIYGGPGTGKTPLIKTAPSPVLCAIEPGLLSMRDAANIPTWEADTPAKINEFFDWILRSPEANQFETICIDSISELAELVLKQEEKANSHGLKAYGEMSKKVMNLVNALYYMPNKHLYMTAKLDFRDEQGVNTKVPAFPGKDLNKKIPHLFDEIFHIGEESVPGVNTPCMAIRTKSSYGVLARDRSGKLDEFEQPHLANIFAKCMS